MVAALLPDFAARPGVGIPGGRLLTRSTAPISTRMFSARWLVAIAVAVGLSSAGTAQAAPHFGFTGAAKYNSFLPEKDNEIAKLEAAAGADVRRLTMLWKEVEGTLDASGNPVQHWGYYDRVINNRLDKGIRPIIVIMAAPRWAQNTWACKGEFCPPAPDHLDDWAEFAYDVAKRYPRAAAIEVWNEPSLRGQWTMSNGPDPEYYARVFSYAAGAIHYADPSIPVLVGSVTYWPQDEPKLRMTIPTFLNRFYAAGGGAQLRPGDGVGLHAYPWINELETLDRQFAKIMAQIRGVLAQRDPTRKIWVTETGATTSGNWAVSQREQALGILTLKRKVSAMSDVGAVLIHSAVESPWDPNHPQESGYGLLKRSDLAPKMAYCALAELAGSPRELTGCAPGVLEELGYAGGGGGSGGDGTGGGGGDTGGGDTGGGGDGDGSATDLRREAKRHCRAKYKATSWWPYATRKERRRAVRPCIRRYIRRHS